MSPVSPPPSSVVAELERVARTELSRGARLGHVLLALAASAMTIVVVALWSTEPALPLRTRAAFGVLTGVGLGWVAFSAWVLRSRGVLLAHHRMVAGRLAVAFSGVFTAGCLALAAMGGTAAARPALAMGLILLGAAIVVWHRASMAHAGLVARRAALERELAAGPR